MPPRRKIPVKSLLTVDLRSPAPDGTMVRRRRYRVELDPNNKQRTILEKHADAARFAWNWGLLRKKEFYEKTGKPIFRQEIAKEWVIAKRETFQWANEVNSHATAQQFQNLEKAFADFFDGGSRYPKKKTTRRGRGSFSLKGYCTTVEDGRVKLPTIGWIRVKQRGYIPVNRKVINTTVFERCGRWFISVQIDELHPVPNSPIGGPIGIDVGINTFAVTSDGNEIQSPRPLSRSMKRLQRLHRRLTRKLKGSKNREKARKKLAKLNFRISNQRENFVHQTSSQLTKSNSLIAIETLNVAGMVKHPTLSRSIHDAGWGAFRKQLKYKCQWYGAVLVEVDRFFPSTKTCSRCGNRREMALKERTFECPKCGLKMCRDLNAAKNILVEGLKQIRLKQPEYRLVEDAGRPAPEKQESSTIAEKSA